MFTTSFVQVYYDFTWYLRVEAAELSVAAHVASILFGNRKRGGANDHSALHNHAIFSNTASKDPRYFGIEFSSSKKSVPIDEIEAARYVPPLRSYLH
jgi:hypothetical protein